jgi:hypothetical protein
VTVTIAGGLLKMGGSRAAERVRGMHAEAASDPTRKRRSSEGPFPIRLRLLEGFSVWVGSRAVSEGAWNLRKATGFFLQGNWPGNQRDTL